MKWGRRSAKTQPTGSVTPEDVQWMDEELFESIVNSLADRLDALERQCTALTERTEALEREN